MKKGWAKEKPKFKKKNPTPNKQTPKHNKKPKPQP